VAGLRCERLAKAYGERHVLEDVDLEVEAGTLTAILGASGSGKTTLLRLVIGFITADRGVVSIGGRVVADPERRVHVPPDKRAVGYVAQEGALFPHLTVAENVGFGLPRRERGGRRIDEVLDLVGLDSSYAARQPNQLSGGEQRRVALARALAPRPAMVLLDEPFSGLDAALRAETRTAVLDAMAAVGATALLVTHDQAEALSMGHQVAVLRSGRLVQTASPTALYRTPNDLEVAQFVGDAVVIEGVVDRGVVACALGILPIHGVAEEGGVRVMIRPEQIRVSSDAAGDPAVPAKVVGQSFFGPDTLLRLELSDGAATRVTARLLGESAPSVGQEVRLQVEGAVMTFPGPA
jgi:iron(III) transport system ATP-binding protein